MDLLQLISTAEIIEEYGDGYSIFDTSIGTGKTYTKKNKNYLTGVDDDNAVSFFITFDSPATSVATLMFEYSNYTLTANDERFQVYTNNTNIVTSCLSTSQSINQTNTTAVPLTASTKYSLGYSLRWGKDINVYLYNHSTSAITTYYSAATNITKIVYDREIIKIGQGILSNAPVPRLYRYYMWDKPISWNQFDLIRKSV